MTENKLNIDDPALLADTEERIAKKKALLLFDRGGLELKNPGSFEALREIHRYLFEDIYTFAGKVRGVDMSKGGFLFAPVCYLSETLNKIEKMPQSDFFETVEKYVEMNIAHPFRDGNGRSMRIWLNCILQKVTGQIVDWSLISEDEYLSAMEKSVADDSKIKKLLESALSDRAIDRDVYMRGIDRSFLYEGMSLYKTEEL